MNIPVIRVIEQRRDKKPKRAIVAAAFPTAFCKRQTDRGSDGVE
jgi:hypothetical protein